MLSGRPEAPAAATDLGVPRDSGRWQGSGEGDITACVYAVPGGAGTLCSDQAHPGPILRKPTGPKVLLQAHLGQV